MQRRSVRWNHRRRASSRFGRAIVTLHATPGSVRQVPRPNLFTAVAPWLPATGVFLLTLALFTTWAIGMPRFSSPDEPAHLFKAYGVGHGQLLGNEVDGLDSNIRSFDVPLELGTPDLRCYFGNPNAPANCAQEPVGLAVSTAAVYPPYWYAVVGVPPRVVGFETSLRAYRVMSALLCAALTAAALEVARRSSARRFSSLMLLPLTPMAVFLAGSVNPNAFEVVGCMLLWALWLLVPPRAESADRPAPLSPPGLRAGLAVGALMSALLLSRYAAAFTLAAGAVVFAVWRGRAGLRPFLRRQFWLPLFACLAVTAVLVLWWATYANVTVTDSSTASAMGRWGAITSTLFDLPELARQLIGVLGWLDTELPLVVHLAVIALTLLVLAGVVASRDRRLQAATATTIVALVLMPPLVNAITAPTAGLIWQGRYSLALFAVLAPLGMLGWQQAAQLHQVDPSGALLSSHGPLNPNGHSKRAVGWVCPAAALLFTIAEVLAFWQALRRFSVGANGTWLLTGALPWHPAVAPMLLIALNALVAIGLCAVVLASSRTRSTQERQTHESSATVLA